VFFFYKGVFWHSAAYVLLMLSIPIGHGWERVRFIFTGISSVAERKPKRPALTTVLPRHGVEGAA
jgi:hypothetical protein